MGEGANYRNAITGSFPAVTACAHATIGTGTFPSQHGITGHNIRDGSEVAQGLRRRRAREPRRHPDPDARRPVERRDRQPRVGRRDRLPGLAHGDDRLRRAEPDRRTSCRSASTGTKARTSRTASASGRRTTPTCSGCRRPCPGSTCYDAHLAGVRRRPSGTGRSTRRDAQTPCCAPPVVQYQGDLIEATLRQRADRAERRHGPALHQLQGAGLHRSHLQHEVAVGGSRRSRRSTRSSDGWSPRSTSVFPNEYVADRDRRPRTVPAARTTWTACAWTRSSSARTIEQRFGGELGHRRAERGAVRGLPARGRAARRTAPRSTTSPRRLRDYRYRQNIGPYVPASAIEQDLLDDARVLGGVLHDVPRIARGRGPVGVRRDHVHRCRPRRDPGDPLDAMAVELTASRTATMLDRPARRRGGGMAMRILRRDGGGDGRLTAARRRLALTSTAACTTAGPGWTSPSAAGQGARGSPSRPPSTSRARPPPPRARPARRRDAAGAAG